MSLSLTQRKRLGTIGRYIVIIFWMLFTLLPIYTAFVASLTEYENLGKSFLFPTDWAWHNYADIFQRVDMTIYLRSTFIYALSTAVINVILATFTGYALSRFRFRGKGFYSSVLLVTQVLPQVVIVVPVFLLMQQLGLYDTYPGIIITIVATSMAFPTLLMPGIGTAFGLSFFSGWSQYLYPLILTRDPAKTPVTVGIARLIDNQTPWEMVMTGTLISIIPAILIYLLVQKSLIKGMASGAVK